MAPIVGVQCWIARTALGWSKMRLARSAKVSLNTVSRFEGGGAVGPILVQAIQDTLERARAPAAASVISRADRGSLSRPTAHGNGLPRLWLS